MHTRSHFKVGVSRHMRGFTLIELAIVLVIIGLITGGVLVGRDMIKAAQLREIGTMIEEYKLSMSTFRSKYNCIPGDCKKATNFFGVTGNGCMTWGPTAFSDGTCNGDGNKVLGPAKGWDGNGAPDEVAELVLFWNHLSHARMIQGNYGCMSKIITAFNDPACSPMPKTPQAGSVVVSIRPGYLWNGVWGVQHSKQDKRHQFVVGGIQGILNASAAFSPQEASIIDTKFDDGKPFSGWINAPWGTTSDVGNGLPICTLGYEYRTEEDMVPGISVSSRNCILYFDAGF